MSDKQLTIEAGKHYRSSNGEKWYVLSVELPNPYGRHDELPVLAARCRNGERSWFTLRGRVKNNERGPDDLIVEWVEPEKVTAIVHMFRGCDGTLHVQAGELTFVESLGSVRVIIEEGKFAE